MPLANGRTYLAIPGPSVVPDRVLQAMHQASPNIYEGALVDMVPGIVSDLKSIAGTRHNAAIYIANGHGAWEAAISNLFNPGDQVLLLATGMFGHGWGEIAKRLRVDVKVLDFGLHRTYDVKAVHDALSDDKEHRIKAVLICHVDTSTSILNDIKLLRQTIDATSHPALFMVDCIASMGCERFEMDRWGVDLAIAASQKGLMTPPGMGFVFFNEKASAIRENCKYTSSYWDWQKRANPERFYEYFGGTAPTQHLFGLRTALDMINQEGLENVWDRHKNLARAYWAAFDAWGQTGPLTMNVADPAIRANSVTALSIGTPYGTQLRQWLMDNTGVTLGVSLGMGTKDDPNGEGFFRVGHMGHINAHMVLGVIGAIEAGLEALEIPHGRGGIAAATKIIAKA